MTENVPAKIVENALETDHNNTESAKLSNQQKLQIKISFALNNKWEEFLLLIQR